MEKGPIVAFKGREATAGKVHHANSDYPRRCDARIGSARQSFRPRQVGAQLASGQFTVGGLFHMQG
jgi:hypothetical protein